MRLIGGVIFLVVFGTMFLSLFHMSTGMDMNSGMPDCPLMLDQSVVCQMDLNDHISAWKSLFLALVPTITLILVAVGLILFVFTRAPNLLLKKVSHASIVLSHILDRVPAFSQRALQELFASGILHPRLYNTHLS